MGEETMVIATWTDGSGADTWAELRTAREVQWYRERGATIVHVNMSQTGD